MADTKETTGSVLVAQTTTGPETISKDAPMPPPEPGHTIAEEKHGEVFDPNAALREAQGRGPGLQDSEAVHPAVWVQDVDPLIAVEREIARRERELKQLKQQRDDLKKSA